MTPALPGRSIQPGKLYLARSPMVLQTILGSCVSATFRHAKSGAGAMCHGVLPRCPAGADPAELHRYVDFSIRYLIRQFDSLGAIRAEVEVKLFGGADVLQIPPSRTGKATVGAMNCEVALEVLKEEGFTVSASDLGGKVGRTIHFDTATGEVLVHRLNGPGSGNGPQRFAA
jgi:chemotaxis protein CheD